MAGIFITYRRIDSEASAGRLFDRLTTTFGPQSVFMDTEGGISRGEDFPTAIENALRSASAVVAVIGPKWLTCTDDAGQRRLDNPDDWVRLEIRTALERGLLLMPVLVGGAGMPLPADLPTDIKELARRQKSEIGSGRWDADVSEITKALRSVVISNDGSTSGPAPAPGRSLQSPVVLSPDERANVFDLIVFDEISVEGKAGSPKFARMLASYGGARVLSAMPLRATKDEPAALFGRIIGTHERIKSYTNREQGSLPDDESMKAFGGELFATLLPGDVRRLYDEARTRQQRRLDVVLTSTIPWISEKPWEWAYDTARQSFLATDIHFVRNVLTNVPADPVIRRTGPLKILVAAAQPVGFGWLSIDQEAEVIRRGFSSLVDAGLADIKVVPRITPDRLQREISTGAYQVVHFIGHGTYDDLRREGHLIFQNERAGESSLGYGALREIFCQRGLSLVFLCACQSGRGGRADFNKGVAPHLVASGLPALVAHQYAVVDSSPTLFAQSFYASVAQGLSLAQSARDARAAVAQSLGGDSIDWAIPVLYARDPALRLSAPSGRPLSSRAPKSVRTEPNRAVKVVAWDVDDVFPALEKTMGAMHAAQSTFGFELVDVSVPLDAWDLGAQKGTNFLWAEKFAKRLTNKPAELGADVLLCVTRHWLRDDSFLYLYGWWPEGITPPVILISVAGFDQLKPEGVETDRVLANSVVAVLAGFFGQMATHSNGVKSCPLYFDQQSDFKHRIEEQRFDAGCRRRLNNKLGDQKLTALEALLKVFRGQAKS